MVSLEELLIATGSEATSGAALGVIGFGLLVAGLAVAVWQRNTLAAYARQLLDVDRRLIRRGVGAMKRSATTFDEETIVDDTYEFGVGAKVWDQVRWHRDEYRGRLVGGLAAGAARIPARVGHDIEVGLRPREGLRANQIEVTSRRRAPGVAALDLQLFLLGTGEVYEVDRSSMILGRDPESDLFIDDAAVSWSHARLTVDDDRGLVLYDLDSLNGTYVDQRLVRQPVALCDGQIIELGRTQLKLVMNNSSPTSVLAGATVPLTDDHAT